MISDGVGAPMSVEHDVSRREKVYADDLVPGQEFDLGTWHFTEKDIIAFATSWDPLPIHVDPEAAAHSPFGGVIASGIHSMAVMQRLSVEGFYRHTSIIAGRNILSCDLLAPARTDATVRGVVRIIEVRPREGRRDAIVRTESLLVTDGNSDEVIYRMIGDSLWACR